MQYIAFDSHKRYTYAVVEEKEKGRVMEKRIEHRRGEIGAFLSQCEVGSPVALETIGSWYWIVDEIEAAGMLPRLVNARKAKMMIASSKKTDRLDAKGLNTLQRTGTLPTVWIPSSELRDIRELYRTRMVLTQMVIRLKNRILSCFSKYGISFDETSDAFNIKGCASLEAALEILPTQTCFAVKELLRQLDLLQEAVKEFEARMLQVQSNDPEIKLLQTIPGCGPVTAWTIRAYTDDIRRFARYKQYSSYAGLVPWVECSNETVHYGKITKRGPEELRTAFVQLVMGIRRSRSTLSWRLMVQYESMKRQKGTGKSIIATARKMSKIVWYMLMREEEFKTSLMVDTKLDSVIQSMREEALCESA